MWRTAVVCLSGLLFTACGSDDSDDSTGSSATEPVTNRSLAFPGAEGSAATITGGANTPRPYIVTNLNDSGEGSLRDAVSTSGRTIVFAVSGTINLKSNLNITANNLTIAGQSAPGDGICVAGYPVKISKSKNIIVRYMRFRLGDQNIEQSNFDADSGDALEVKDSKDIMIDHCSISWSTDECASFPRVSNLTVQYCIISESLKLSGHSKGNHGYGGIWGGSNATYHHNLLADHDSRNPRFGHQYTAYNEDTRVLTMGTIDYVNNVVYDWGGNSCYGGESCDEAYHINMIGNYYKPAKNATHTSSNPNRLLEMTGTCDNCEKVSKASCHPGYFYISGNYVNGNASKDWDAVDSKNTTYKLNSRYTTGLTSVIKTPENAEQAYETVLAYAGACGSNNKRDAVDERIVRQVKNDTGKLINRVSDTGAGYPTLSDTGAPADTDGDGMPDAWETEQLKTNNITDKTFRTLQPNAYTFSKKYTNLEVYLNSLVVNTFPTGAGAGAIK